jgi:hypothetical protein
MRDLVIGSGAETQSNVERVPCPVAQHYLAILIPEPLLTTVRGEGSGRP